MTSMNLVFRPSHKQGRCPGSLSVRLIHDRQVKCITLKGCRLYANEWDQQTQTIVYPTDNPGRLADLQNIAQVIFGEKNLLEIYLQTLQKEGYYSVTDLAKLYCLRKDESNLMGYTELLALEMERRGQLRTARAYRTITRRIVLFNHGKDIPLRHINARLVKDFENHLKVEGRLPNTISYYMRNLRAIYNKAIADKRIVRHPDEKPFAGVYTGVTKTMKRALSLEDVKKIHTLDFYSLLHASDGGPGNYARMESLEVARSYFLFQFYARGMCFVDLARLQKSNIRNGVLRYVRKKTGRQIEVRITEQMQSILDSFALQVRNSTYLFPITCIEKTKSGTAKETRLQYETALRTQNNRLKQLAALAGLHKGLSTHVARHTWATIGKQQNLPLQVICECLGHSSEKITQIYLNQLDNSVLDEANLKVALAVGQKWNSSSSPFSSIYL